MGFFAFFNNAHFHIYFSWELMILWVNKMLYSSKYGLHLKILTYIIIFIIRIFPKFDFVIILFFCIIIILYYLFCYSSWAKKLDEFINIVNRNSQLRQSRHLLVHLHNPKNHLLSNKQQRLSLMLQTNIKTIFFCIPLIPSRMMQPS